MKKADEAERKHQAGYNCCQAVACAFSDEAGVDESLIYKMGEGFGAGMGNGQGVCGAIAGAVMVAGLFNSDGDTDHAGQTKRSTYIKAAQMQNLFTERAKRLICHEIKTGNDGRAFTSCSDCVRIAAEITEEVLGL